MATNVEYGNVGFLRVLSRTGPSGHGPETASGNHFLDQTSVEGTSGRNGVDL